MGKLSSDPGPSWLWSAGAVGILYSERRPFHYVHVGKQRESSSHNRAKSLALAPRLLSADHLQQHHAKRIDVYCSAILLLGLDVSLVRVLSKWMKQYNIGPLLASQ